MFDRLRCPPGVAGNHRPADSGPLKKDGAQGLDIEAEPARTAGHRKDIAGAKIARQFLVAYPPGEDHPIRHVCGPGQPVQ